MNTFLKKTEIVKLFPKTNIKKQKVQYRRIFNNARSQFHQFPNKYHRVQAVETKEQARMSWTKAILASEVSNQTHQQRRESREHSWFSEFFIKVVSMIPRHPSRLSSKERTSCFITGERFVSTMSPRRAHATQDTEVFFLTIMTSSASDFQQRSII